eukprot:15333922-Ditylum_brightwellii.AAC.1
MVSSTNDGKDIDSNFGSFNVGRTDPRRTCIGVGIYDTLPMMTLIRQCGVVEAEILPVPGLLQ